MVPMEGSYVVLVGMFLKLLQVDISLDWPYIAMYVHR